MRAFDRTTIVRHQAGSHRLRELDLPEGLDDIFVAGRVDESYRA